LKAQFIFKILILHSEKNPETPCEGVGVAGQTMAEFSISKRLLHQSVTTLFYILIPRRVVQRRRNCKGLPTNSWAVGLPTEIRHLPTNFLPYPGWRVA
jgi:hypothetical protein